MRIIALLLAFVLTGCTGNRLNAETKPTAVAVCAPPTAAAFAAAVMAATTIYLATGPRAAFGCCPRAEPLASMVHARTHPPPHGETMQREICPFPIGRTSPFCQA